MTEIILNLEQLLNIVCGTLATVIILAQIFRYFEGFQKRGPNNFFEALFKSVFVVGFTALCGSIGDMLRPGTARGNGMLVGAIVGVRIVKFMENYQVINWLFD